MRRFLASFGCLMLILTLWMSTVAHAAEPIACPDSATSESISHYDGDGDQVPADADRAVLHHHGGCHGHHVAVPDTGKSVPAGSVHIGRFAALIEAEHPSARAPAALRPPIA
jgi:hypothetical protein